MKWFIKCLKQYADFKGRARRSEYWWFGLINIIICIVLIIPWLFSSMKTSSPWYWVYMAYCLVMLLPSLAVMVRRFHDIGRSGWWLILVFCAMLLNRTSGLFRDNLAIFLILSLSGLAISIVVLVWMCTNSEPGSNRWGENPKGE